MQESQSFYKILESDPSKGFRHLYACAKPVKKWLKQNGAGTEECKDIIQDSLMAFYHYAEKHRFALNIQPEQLLFGIAKKVWYKQLRIKKTMPEVELSDSFISESELDEIMERETQYKKLHNSLQSLGKTCREILHLFYFKKQSMEEIARITGLRNAHVVKAMKYQCLAKAKDLINP